MDETVNKIVEKIAGKLGELEPTAIEAFYQLVGRERLISSLYATIGMLMVAVVIYIWKLFDWAIEEETSDPDKFFVSLWKHVVCGVFLIISLIVVFSNLADAVYPLASLID